MQANRKSRWRQHRGQSRSFVLLVVVLAFGSCIAFQSPATAGDFLGPELPSRASPAQRLKMEQIEELIAARQPLEVIENLEKLFEQAGNRVVASGNIQKSGTLSVRKSIPLRVWVQRRLIQFLVEHPDANQAYQERIRESAKTAFASMRRTKDIAEVAQAVDRYAASEVGVEFGHLLADVYLEQGWGLGSLQVAQATCDDLRLPLFDTRVNDQENDRNAMPNEDTVSWWHAWRSVGKASTQHTEILERRLARPTVSGKDRRSQLAQTLKRVLQAVALKPAELDRALLLRWVEFVLPNLDEAESQELREQIKGLATWGKGLPVATAEVATFAGTSTRSGVVAEGFLPGDWPKWSQPLPRFTATTDASVASKPRVGEAEQGTLPYHPVVAQDRVFVNTLTRVFALSLKDGKYWPNSRASRPIFESGTAHAALIPLNYPMLGTARATLCIDGEQLFARVGNPVTGWISNRPAEAVGSVSSIVGLDLKRDGAMLPGFPLKLDAQRFENAEFEGSPIVVGDFVVVAVCERDDVGLVRSVVAFDRNGGKVLWRSAALASGNLEGMDRANLLSHQLLSYAGGRVFYNAGLGVIACLDVQTGNTVWISEYSRVDKRQQKYPTTDRFRYRDLTPCILWKGLLYCAPQDAAEIFALDACTGDLVWASDAGQTADLIHLLGVSGSCLVAGGDHLVWLDRLSGKPLGRFPDSTTPGNVNVLPQPRGMGRGVVTEQYVYWPVQGELLVFSAEPKTISEPTASLLMRPVKRVELESFANEGANVLFVGNRLLLATPSRLLAFGPDDKNSALRGAERKKPTGALDE